MQLLALGLNHETASLDLREKASFGPDILQQAVVDLTHSGGANEATILSTCNRTEIYVGHDKIKSDRIIAWLSEYSGFQQMELQQSLYEFPDERAVQHAFRVASGLDSMVLGEPQILGQMKDAYAVASQAGATGKVLNRLFHHTFTVAKQVRTDTSIGENPVSVAYAGVNLAKRVFDKLSDQTVLMIGAGETIELVARHLKENQVKRMMIANRSIKKARKLAEIVNCEAIGLADIPERLHEADILVSSTASTLPILGKGAVEQAIKQRKHKPMFILDLAVPRDVEPEVGSLPDVYLYTVDDLKSVVSENQGKRQKAADQAENIIDLQVVRFMRWMRSLDAVPAIRRFRENLDEVRQQELALAVKKLSNGEDPEVVLSQFSQRLMNKYAHQPGQSLKQADMDGDTELVSAARKLFGL